MEGVSNVSFFIYFVLSLSLTELEIFYSFGLSYSRIDFYSRYLISFVLLTRYLSKQYTLYKKTLYILRLDVEVINNYWSY